MSFSGASQSPTAVNSLWKFNIPQQRQPVRRSSTLWRSLKPRHTLAALCFLATLSAYVERTGFSIAYTAMAHEAKLDEGTKGGVLSAFYWGYALSQIPGGWAAQRYGGDIMLSVSFFLWSTASILTPGNANNVRATVLARLCVGVAQGFLIPSVHTVLSIWIPPAERARAVSLTTSGMYLGSAVAMVILPAAARVFGPAFLLKLVGAVGLCWLAFFRMTMKRLETATGKRRLPIVTPVAPSSSSPSNPASSTTSGHSKTDRTAIMTGKPGSTPWGRMLKSSALWAIVINNFTFHYAFYVIMNWLPTYFESLLGVELSTLGIAKCLPYLGMFVASNAGGWAGDALILKALYKVGPARKVVNTIGFWATAGSLMLLSRAVGVWSGIFFVTLTLGTAGFARGGFSVNHMDIAPKYAGVVMGISNTAGTVAGMIGVAVTGQLLELSGGAAMRSGWTQAFLLASIQCIAGSFVFIKYARGERLFGGDAPEPSD